MLIDDLRHASWLPERERVLLQQAVVFDITAVADYARTMWMDAHKAIEFPPNCAPLAPAAWYEWQGRGWGYLWDGAETIGVFIAVAGDARAPLPWGNVGLDSAEVPAGTRWACFTRHVLRTTGQLGMLSDMLHLYVADDGTLLHADLRPLQATVPIAPPEERALHQYKLTLLMALTAVCFAHCKGVTTTEHQQPRQQRRAAERTGHPPLVAYKTIDIAPVTRILSAEGHIEKTGIKKALHITRGHFAHYTDDAPLFGKYTGTFYKPMHVRGTLERGAVVKDYRVLPGEETPPLPRP